MPYASTSSQTICAKNHLVAWTSCESKPKTTYRWKKWPRYEIYTPLTANHTTILEEAFNLEPSLLGYQTITKQEQCSEDIKRSSTGTRKQTEDRKTEADKDTSNSGVSDNLHQNKNPPQHGLKSEPQPSTKPAWAVNFT
ncbi:hypothetical protein JHK85_010058 [Glycine max]|nr:hypothetical protein JHK85_010058 [Glycine max]